PSCAASPAPSARVRASRHLSAGGFAPPHPPTRSLVRRFAGALRSRARIASSLSGGLRPAAPPYTLPRAPLRRRPPLACAHRVISQRGASPRRTPLHAPSCAASPAPSARVRASRHLSAGGFAPPHPPTRSLVRRFAGAL